MGDGEYDRVSSSSVVFPGLVVVAMYCQPMDDMLAHALDIVCPWCGAESQSACVKLGTKELATQTHKQRRDYGETHRYQPWTRPPEAKRVHTRSAQSSSTGWWVLVAAIVWGLFALVSWSLSGSTSDSDDSPPASGCHDSYTPCVPNDRGDIDCGDLSFSVRVSGPDVYGLDRDADGSGCERNG